MEYVENKDPPFTFTHCYSPLVLSGYVNEDSFIVSRFAVPWRSIGLHIPIQNFTVFSEEKRVGNGLQLSIILRTLLT